MTSGDTVKRRLFCVMLVLLTLWSAPASIISAAPAQASPAAPVLDTVLATPNLGAIWVGTIVYRLHDVYIYEDGGHSDLDARVSATAHTDGTVSYSATASYDSVSTCTTSTFRA